MIDQSVTFKAPIKVVEFNGKIYYLIIEDADGIRHYFHHKHTNPEYGKFKQGQYDGYSFANEPHKHMLHLNDDDIEINKN